MRKLPVIIVIDPEKGGGGGKGVFSPSYLAEGNRNILL